jgi:hypothetical protein
MADLFLGSPFLPTACEALDGFATNLDSANNIFDVSSKVSQLNMSLSNINYNSDASLSDSASPTEGCFDTFFDTLQKFSNYESVPNSPASPVEDFRDNICTINEPWENNVLRESDIDDAVYILEKGAKSKCLTPDAETEHGIPYLLSQADGTGFGLGELAGEYRFHESLGTPDLTPFSSKEPSNEGISIDLETSFLAHFQPNSGLGLSFGASRKDTKKVLRVSKLVRSKQTKKSFLITVKLSKEPTIMKNCGVTEGVLSLKSQDWRTKGLVDIYKLKPISQLKRDPKYKLKETSSVAKNLAGLLEKQSNKRLYFSRINMQELAFLLGLQGYNVDLTIEIEKNVLRILEEWCGFRLGQQSWVRDTSEGTRRQLIDYLHSFTNVCYPEITRSQLEIIVKRGAYNIMQGRLRKQRKASFSTPYQRKRKTK